MQIYADVTGREVEVGASPQAPALGLGDVRRGRGRRRGAAATTSIEAAAAAMARLHDRTFRPDAGTANGVRPAVPRVPALHDYFGRGGNDVMKRLRAIRDEASASRPRAAAGQRAGGAVDWRTISDGLITLTIGWPRGVGVARVLDGQLDALGDDRGGRHPQRGQRRDGVAREQDVVEADDRQVAGTVRPRL